MNDGVLWVGGRFDCVDFSYDVKYLMILFGKYCVIEMIIFYYYFVNGYVGFY